MIRRSLALAGFLFVLSLAAVGLHAAAKNTILVNRIGPSSGVLYIANSDGSGERPLASGGNFEYDPSYSADGQWIVFTSERSGPANIYRIHPDGSALERLTSDNFDDAGSLSPDGSQLVYVSTRDSGATNLWILDVKTRKSRNLTVGLISRLRQVNWTVFSGPPGPPMANGSRFPRTGIRNSRATRFQALDGSTSSPLACT
jgi:dipeptidyl aminopeptidase/acylaminoacyl peptidase